MTETTKGLVYDANAVSRILGLPCESSDPVPDVADGEIVIYYGGWDLKQLRLSKAGQQRMLDHPWYEEKGWKAEPGYYRLNLRVANSNRKTWNEQVAHLRTIDETLQPASVTVAASALLVHLTETGKDLLQNDWCRCSGPLPDGNRAVLAVRVGRVLVYNYWGDRRDDYFWLASSLLVAPRTS